MDGSGLKSIWPLRLGPPDLQSNPRYALRDVEVTAYGRNFAKLSHYYAATPRTKLAPRLVISALTTVRCQPSRRIGFPVTASGVLIRQPGVTANRTGSWTVVLTPVEGPGVCVSGGESEA